MSEHLFCRRVRILLFSFFFIYVFTYLCIYLSIDFSINSDKFKSVSIPEHLFWEQSSESENPFIFFFSLSMDLLIYGFTYLWIYLSIDFSINLSEFKSVSMSEHLFCRRVRILLFFSFIYGFTYL